MRKYGRVDANQKVVKAALENELHATVESLADLGDGIPDLLVGYKSHNILLEVKDGEKPPSRTRLTLAQRKWHARWKGTRPFVVHSPNEAVVLLVMLYGSPEPKV